MKVNILPSVTKGLPVASTVNIFSYCNQMNTSSSSSGQRAEELADRLHSAAIHLLRRLRVHDRGSGLTASRLSALSVIVFSGPIRLGDLAAAEQVRPSSMSRMVSELERAGLVRRRPDPVDGRAQLVEATGHGRQLLDRGRRRRVEALATAIERLGGAERSTLARSVALLERLVLPDAHPQRGP